MDQQCKGRFPDRHVHDTRSSGRAACRRSVSISRSTDGSSRSLSSVRSDMSAGHTPNAFENNPMDALAGIRIFPARWLGFGAGVRYHVNEQERTVSTQTRRSRQAISSNCCRVAGRMYSCNHHEYIYGPASGIRAFRRPARIYPAGFCGTT